MQDISHEAAHDMDHLMSHAQFTNVLFPEIMTLTAPRGDELVLDVGTGTGQLAHALTTKINRGCIIGVDWSESMLKVAREKAVKQEMVNYYPIKGIAEGLLFKDGVFDLAFCVRALHHFADPQQALHEVCRVLKPDGALLLCEPLGPVDEKLREVLTEAFQAAHPDHRLFSGEQLDRMVAIAGLKELRGTEISLAFHQEGLGGVPMGPHYMEAYHMIKMRGDIDLLHRFFDQVFQVTEGPQGVPFIHGSLGFLISLLQKAPAAKRPAAKNRPVRAKAPARARAAKK